jgi:hypothetical protein
VSKSLNKYPKKPTMQQTKVQLRHLDTSFSPNAIFEGEMVTVYKDSKGNLYYKRPNGEIRRDKS